MKVSMGKSVTLLLTVLVCILIFSVSIFAQTPKEDPVVKGNSGSAGSDGRSLLNQSSIPAEEVDYVIQIQDRDGRPLKLDKKSGLRCIPFAYKSVDGESKFDAEIVAKAALTYFNFKGEAKTVFDNSAKDGEVILKLARAKEGGEVIYKLDFYSKDENFKDNKLLAKYENLSVKTNDKPNENKAGFRSVKVRLNEVHRPTSEIVAVIVFVLVAVFCAWLVSSKCFFSALVRGRAKSPSTAQTYSIFSTLALTFVACLCAVGAWFFPRVSGGFFPYDLMVFIISAYFIALILFWIICKVMDKPTN